LQIGRSGLRVEKAPRHGSDVVEELEREFGSSPIDCPGSSEETKMGVDLFRGTVGNAPVVIPIAT
jgi:hypothetical protein